MFRKVLVANRGEIAVRVMRACEELGIRTVAVYSEADTDAGHVRYADEAYNIGPARAADSYLDHDAVLSAAERAGADAIHPGYGFLAENAAFARAVQNHGFTWVGPDPEAMAALGEKTKARSLMQQADVPVVPGTTEPVESVDEIIAVADEYGYPVAIKAEGGGGGRGLKVVHSESEVESQFETAKREGEAYFDNDSVYVEKYLEAPRHIEVQILADHHGNVRHLGERDCSLQRRHQKVIEEAPSPALDDDLREQIGEAAKRGVDEAGYTNAGTVEFLVEDSVGSETQRADGEAVDRNFYFMEVNTRIQVEHTVTEEITGLDIVKWQLRVAAGEELSFAQDDIEFDGHAMEFRINAEQAADGFAPATGGVAETYDPPGGIGVRMDDAIRQGDTLVTDYDSMIAKLIVHAGDREECLTRAERALAEFDIVGFPTIIPFHRLMLTDEAFSNGEHTTKYLDEQLDTSRIEEAVAQWGAADSDDDSGDDADDRTERTFTAEVNGKRFEVVLEEHGAPAINLDSIEAAGGSARPPQAKTENDDDAASVEGGDTVTAEMQGTILSVNVEAGDEIAAGDVVCVLEAMKMENDVATERGGGVTEVLVGEGDSVDMGDVLVVLE